MNILITGGTGLLGRSLISILIDNHNLFVIVREESIDTLKYKNIQIINENLVNINPNKIPKNIDIVYYLAQSRKFREFPNEALDIFEVNISAPLKIINWAVKRGVKKFFYTSTGGVYKNPTKPVKEFFSINANEKNGFYLDSKLASEILLKNYSKYFETFAIIRPFFIYGFEQEKHMFMARLINNINIGKKIFLDGEEGIKVNPIFVEDAAIALEKLLYIKGEHIFNFAGFEEISIKTLSLLIGKIINKKIIFEIKENLQNDIIADISLMKKFLYSPNTSLEIGLKKTIDKMGLN